MSNSRVQSLLIATKSRYVVYERFYESFSEADKAAIREAFDETADSSPHEENHEIVGRYKNGRIAVVPSGELLFCGLGTGEYNELAVSEILKTIIGCYKEIFKVQALSDTALLQNFAQTALVIDEVCKEGLVEYCDTASLQKALAFKVPIFGSSSDESRGLMGKLTSKELLPSLTSK